MAISQSKKTNALGCPAAAELYWAQFRKNVFTLIKMGYDRLDSASLREAEETDITGELAKVMDEIIKCRFTTTHR